MFAFPKLSSPAGKDVSLLQFSGLDTRTSAGAGSLKSQKNMSSMALPCLSTRFGRKKILTVNAGESIVGAYFFDKAYLVTNAGDQTRLYCGDDFTELKLIFTSNDGEVATSLMHRFHRMVCIFNIFDYENGTSLVSAPLAAFENPARTWAPDFVDVTTYAGRLFGCRINQIRASAHDNVYVWDCEEEMEDETHKAFLQNFPVTTYFTACTTYKNHAVFFTEDEMYELYGDNPQNFELVKIADVGCVNRQSVCQCDGTLYFISREGIYSYSGAMPKKISHEIIAQPKASENSFEAAIGGAAGVIYASYLTDDGVKLYTYDVQRKTWAQEDDIKLVDVVGKYGKAYLVTGDGIYETDCEYKHGEGDNDGTRFEWEAVTAPIYTNTTTLKRAVRVGVFVEQKRSSELELYISLDDGDFELVSREIFSGCKELSVFLGDRHYQKLVLKIKGRGESKLHYISQSYVSGGEVK